ncbi:MAG: hypothetical protein C0619_10505 [Desulfuromonas sp.]|nr:MAG: hypothetical protein C0619_10505 [Desulfuromonas sp.]
MENWLQQLLEWLPAGYGYLALLMFIAFFESLPIIGLLMPGSTLIVLAGFLTVHGKSSLILLILVCIIGAFIGDLTSYWLGSRLGPILLTRKSFRRRKNMIHKAQLFFMEHGGKSLFFARFLGPFRGITPFVAGGARMLPGPFFNYTLISAILWGISYPGLGFLGGASWKHAQDLTTRFGLLIGLALIVTLIHLKLKHKTNNSGKR